MSPFILFHNILTICVILVSYLHILPSKISLTQIAWLNIVLANYTFFIFVQCKNVTLYIYSEDVRRLYSRALEVKYGITNLQRERESNGVWILQRN